MFKESVIDLKDFLFFAYVANALFYLNKLF